MGLDLASEADGDEPRVDYRRHSPWLAGLLIFQVKMMKKLVLMLSYKALLVRILGARL